MRTKYGLPRFKRSIIDEVELRRCWSAAFQPNHRLLDLLDRTPRPRALFTDNGPILEACLRHELEPMAHRFDAVLLSCHLGAIKSEPIAFERAAARLNQPSSGLTLIDDRDTNIAAAIEAGWRAIHFTGIDDLGPADRIDIHRTDRNTTPTRTAR